MAQIVKNDCFRIMNGAGRFSTGGKYPKWTKEGKIWTSESALIRHIKLANYCEDDVLIMQYSLLSSGARSTGFYLKNRNGKSTETMPDWENDYGAPLYNKEVENVK